MKACFELSRRLYAASQSPGRIIKCPDDAAALLMPELKYIQKERFYVILLNTKNAVIDTRLVSEGSLNASIVHSRETFSWAVKRGAAAVICLHSHPSGDPDPSQEDIETTRRLVEAGNILGIKMLDHVIVGSGTGRFMSLKERGLL